jgi:hypothetical protein
MQDSQTPKRDRFERNAYHEAWIARRDKTMAESMPISYEEACENMRIGTTKVETPQTEQPKVDGSSPGGCCHYCGTRPRAPARELAEQPQEG